MAATELSRPLLVLVERAHLHGKAAAQLSDWALTQKQKGGPKAAPSRRAWGKSKEGSSSSRIPSAMRRRRRLRVVDRVVVRLDRSAARGVDERDKAGDAQVYGLAG
jgi:hypothetical protein